MLQRLGRGRSAESTPADSAPETTGAPIDAGDAAAGATATGDGPAAGGGPAAGSAPPGDAAISGGPGGAVQPKRRRPGAEPDRAAAGGTPDAGALPPDFDLAPHDPLHAYLQGAAGPVDITRLELASPALASLRTAGIVLVIPLISSGTLIGLLNLGPRLSERGYSGEDRRLLGALAGYAAPAMRVGQLVRQQQAEARNRERIEQELKVAQLIQQQFLPKSVPALPSWHVAAFYRPARTVGGDFYDFIPLPDGRVMFVVGDVTDKGVPGRAGDGQHACPAAGCCATAHLPR